MTGATRRRLAAGAITAGLLAAQGCGSTGFTAGLATATNGTNVKQLTPAVKAELDKAITQVMKQASIPGVVVGLWMPGNGEYVKAFGVADKTTKAPMTTNLNTRIGSVTKTFTVTGLLKLVDEKKVGLDDPISKYISGVPSGDQITIRELAEMRSGLFSYTQDQDFIKAFLGNPKRSFTPQELLGYAFKHPLMFKPNEKFFYSNTNTVLLGLVVEKLSGQPLGKYLEQNVMAPAHLDHTIFPTDAAFPSPHAQGYTNQTASGKVEQATDWNPSWGWAAGAVISDLQDLKAWAPALATGTLLTPATQAQRLKVLDTNATGPQYGLGIFESGGWIGHNGSLPGYQTLLFYLPSAKATLVLFDNTDIAYEGNEPSTLFGQAITKIITPNNVYAPHADIETTSPTPSPEHP